MSDVVALAVVPAEGDPGRLLVSDFAPAPTIHLCRDGWVRGPGGRGLDPGCLRCGDGACPTCMGPGARTALPLWWHGCPVFSGYDRARRVLPGWMEWPADPTPHGGVAYILRMSDIYGTGGLGYVIRLAQVRGYLIEVQP